MYRIAVIENETELQRYGHANVVRNLTQAIASRPDAKHYSFQSFTSATIESLFQNGTNYILAFDGLFLSTNACSDKVVLNCLRKNKDKFVEFIGSGHGNADGCPDGQSTQVIEIDQPLILTFDMSLTRASTVPFGGKIRKREAASPCRGDESAGKQEEGENFHLS